MKRNIVFLFLFAVFSVFGQEYENAAGLKLGWGIGLNGKHFFNEKNAVEAELLIPPSSFIMSGYYEYHLPAFDEDGLYWLFGGGIHLGVWGVNNNPWDNLNDPLFITGLTAIGGIEYVFQNKPFDIQASIEPRFNLIGNNQFWAIGGITFRYRFAQKSEEEQPAE